MRLLTIVIAIGLLVAGGWYWHEHNPATSSITPDTPSLKKDEPSAVGVATARRGNIHIYLEELGTVTPRSTVTVHTRVEGQLMRILFKEGQLVKAGDVIAELDASPYQAQLLQAQGALKKDQALLKEARVKLDRYKILLAQDTIAKQEYDTQESLVSQYEGASITDSGQIDSANVQINYARITAPVGGRIGLRQVDLGNIVHVNDQSGIATITELQPITVVFSVPEDNIPKVLRHMQNNEKLMVQALDREEKRLIATGELAALDSQVDTTTGTIKCKAEFANKNQALFPNQFVNARLFLETLHGVVLIPDSAILHSGRGSFVFLVKQDDTVTMRAVKQGPAEGINISVESGLEPGDIVVMDGADTLHEGSKVRIMKTAKVLPAERENVPHHKITNNDEKEPDEEKSETLRHDP